ncbi:MAG: methyltransferase domain-containing protein, partial [Candidatus Omnitrophica bacterium]|nr:methyltransferase domain-containing protein [Candidatus Omnitrophota bacterium]
NNDTIKTAAGTFIMKRVINPLLLNELFQERKFSLLEPSSVNLTISENDAMFLESAQTHYLSTGLSSLQNIIEIMSLAQKERNSIERILDFPSGWARELRFIKAYFPDAEITAGDIENDALEFCRQTFKTNTLISKENFSEISREKKFDLIWCGSLFTHINKIRFRRLLEFFIDSLKDKGLLVFTTLSLPAFGKLLSIEKSHGLNKLSMFNLLISYSLSGYGYKQYPEQSSYGISMSKPSWIKKTLNQYSRLKLLSYRQMNWTGLQDVVGCIKIN